MIAEWHKGIPGGYFLMIAEWHRGMPIHPKKRETPSDVSRFLQYQSFILHLASLLLKSQLSALECGSSYCFQIQQSRYHL